MHTFIRNAGTENIYNGCRTNAAVFSSLILGKPYYARSLYVIASPSVVCLPAVCSLYDDRALYALG